MSASASPSPLESIKVKLVPETLKMMQEFLERVAIVTGAREGMGFACAELLAEGGASVVLVSRNEGQLKDVSNRIALKTKNDSVLAVAGDVGKD
jgi:NAD(P)-dependent dehydrogenase (short-subunit alcohol dehydrogenase family)